MDKKPIRIRVGLPVYSINDIMPQCAESIKKLEASKLKKYSFEVVTSAGGSSVHLRNFCVTKGIIKRTQKLSDQFDFYLSIDRDVQFEIENVVRAVELLREGVPGVQKLGVVGAAYSPKANFRDRIYAGVYHEIKGFSPPDKWLAFCSSGVKIVDWVGTGFMLIDAKVFDQMKFPYFQVYPVPVKDEVHYITEDIGICLDIAKMGYKIAVDCNNRISHL
jgi:hypothetical protein